MRWVFLTLVMLSSNCAFAANEKAGELIGYCEFAGLTAPDVKAASASLYCAGYVAGFMDGVSVERFAASRKGAYCLPDKGITSEAAINLLRAYVSVRPDAAADGARVVLYAAIRGAYPCS